MKEIGIHLQYSVFICRLTWRELGALKEAIGELIDEEEDDVRIYPLPENCLVFLLGRAPQSPVDLFELMRGKVIA
ncbi:MAG: CRISPR-associated endonuclease Cas2 [Archaeoglobaceae archaeon]